MKLIKAIKAIKDLMRKKRLGGGNFNYKNSRYISKSGADLIPGDVPVPVGDELQCTLFDGGSYTAVAMCIYEKIFFFIPWHYNEFIVILNSYEYNIETKTAEDIVTLMGKAVNWNKSDYLKPVDGYQGGEYIFYNKDGVATHSYSVDSGDYIVLKRTDIKAGNTEDGDKT